MKTTTSNDASRTSGFIVWSPTGTTPPRIVHGDAQEAIAAANDMSRIHRGQTFHALAIIATAHVAPPNLYPTCGHEEHVPF